MKDKNRHIWAMYGLSDKGMEIADKLMPMALKLVRAYKGTSDGVGLVCCVLSEAIFQVHELPRRAPKKYRERWTWKP